MNTIEHCQQVGKICANLYGFSSIECYIGLYHDYIEDEVKTHDEIEKDLRFVLGEEKAKIAMDGILAITRFKDETYFNYILRCKENPYARRVKIVDLIVNLHLREQEPKDSLKERYVTALKLLTD